MKFDELFHPIQDVLLGHLASIIRTFGQYNQAQHGQYNQAQHESVSSETARGLTADFLQIFSIKNVESFILFPSQINVFDEKTNPNISTFRPLSQQVNYNMRATGIGYVPCNGYVPCQVGTITWHFLIVIKGPSVHPSIGLSTTCFVS